MPETVLLSVTSDFTVKVGLPPKGRLDSYSMRALNCGKLQKGVSRVFCSPDGKVYCIRDRDLYVGPLPSKGTQDWFSTATRVGRYEWGRVKLIAFHPNGILYVTTHEGDIYFGYKPENENVSWFYDRAYIIGRGGWEVLEAMFFDPEGSCYALTNYNTLVKGPRPEKKYHWLTTSQRLGTNDWLKLNHFMGFSPDGKMWCVDKDTGDMYKGNPPKSESANFLQSAENMGSGYNKFYHYNFTKDKTIHNFISFDFLPERAKRLSETPIIIAEKTYDNRKSSSVLKHNFSFEKRIMESSTFTHEHGFSVEVGVEAGFTAGIPFIGETETKVSVNTSTTHNWQFEKANEKEITISSSADVEVEAGKAMKMTASIMSAQLDVPYRARVQTMFGYKTYIEGRWLGMAHYNLMVKQEDYDE